MEGVEPRQKVKTEVSQALFSDDEVIRLAEEFGTPLFVIDERVVRSKLRELEEAYTGFRGPLRVAYSMKANFNPALIKLFISEGILFDVTSFGELYFYLRCGGRAENVVYTSVSEEGWEYLEALRRGVGRIVVSSYNGFLRLREAAKTLGTRARLMLRVNPEVTVKAGVRASYRHGKFGVPFNSATLDSASKILKAVYESPELEFEGFHFHLGSQIEDPTCFLSALDRLESFALRMRREIPELSVRTLDLGGGIPVDYGYRVPTPREIGSVVVERLNRMVDALGRFTVIVESGRYLTAEAGMLISRIVNTKVYAGQKYVFLDAGYHLLLDAALLHQPYPQSVVPEGKGGELSVRVNLAGRLCDTYDIFPLSPYSKLDGAEVGRFVVFRNVGAYSIVFHMPFHCQPKPPIVMRRSDGSYTLVRRGESLEELFMEEGGDLI